MAAHDQVVIQRVEIVMPGPLVDDLDRLKPLRAGGEGGPDDVFKFLIARLEIVPIGGRILDRRLHPGSS